MSGGATLDIPPGGVADIFAKPLFPWPQVLHEMRRQRRALLMKAKKPETCYLGHDEYVEFKRNVRPDDGVFVVLAPLPVGGATVYTERWEGMEIIVRAKPGVHVCEAAP